MGDDNQIDNELRTVKGFYISINGATFEIRVSHYNFNSFYMCNSCYVSFLLIWLYFVFNLRGGAVSNICLRCNIVTKYIIWGGPLCSFPWKSSGNPAISTLLYSLSWLQQPTADYKYRQQLKIIKGLRD